MTPSQFCMKRKTKFLLTCAFPPSSDAHTFFSEETLNMEPKCLSLCVCVMGGVIQGQREGGARCWWKRGRGFLFFISSLRSSFPSSDVLFYPPPPLTVSKQQKKPSVLLFPLINLNRDNKC
uniref:Uncharacterized protein n=1 Tax=Nothobranchius furzeri TaxID=105023 RepID=A0A1A8AQW2_NOTFU